MVKELILDYSEKGRLTPGRKRLFYIFGVILTVGALVLLAFQIIEGLGLSFTISAVSNLLLGIILIIQATEPKFMYKEKYLKVNNDFLEYKLGQFRQVVKVEWRSVGSIEITKKAILITTGDQVYKLKMMHFPSSDEKRLKGFIKGISDSIAS